MVKIFYVLFFKKDGRILNETTIQDVVALSLDFPLFISLLKTSYFLYLLFVIHWHHTVPIHTIKREEN